MPSQIELLVQLQQVDQVLRANTLAVETSEGRVADLDDAYRAKAAATDQGRTEATALSARQRDLEERLSAAEVKMKDRRMRITRIRNDKELGLAKREVEQDRRGHDWDLGHAHIKADPALAQPVHHAGGGGQPEGAPAGQAERID